jgi:uncharacterized protein YkwD
MGSPRRWLATVVTVASLAVVGAACAPAPPVASQSCSMDATSVAVFNLTNQSRAASGVAALAPNGQLTCLAQSWSQHMAATGSFAHRNLGAVINSPGYAGVYHTLGENILLGPASMSAAAMHTAWMNSPDHRANILSGAYSSMGIGLAYVGGSVYATENFGG